VATKQNSKAKPAIPANPLIDGVLAGTLNNIVDVLRYVHEVDYVRTPSGESDAVRRGGFLVMQMTLDALDHLRSEIDAERKERQKTSAPRRSAGKPSLRVVR
jgi:hypothetical protein